MRCIPIYIAFLVFFSLELSSVVALYGDDPYGSGCFGVSTCGSGESSGGSTSSGGSGTGGGGGFENSTCLVNSQCDEGFRCIAGECKIPARNEGQDPFPERDSVPMLNSSHVIEEILPHQPEPPPVIKKTIPLALFPWLLVLLILIGILLFILKKRKEERKNKGSRK